jgi:hypothetical protein
MRRPGAPLVALLALLAAAPAAHADGLPVVDGAVPGAGRDGVTSRDGARRYVALPAGRDTLALAVERDGGRLARSRRLRGRYVVPVVAYDGSAAGVSADGGTLVLISPRRAFPRERTTLLALDARRLRVTRRVALDGDFSFDALSPDGRLLYLVEYLSRSDPNRYRVRVYDLRSGRLLPDRVADPRSDEWEMAGMPVARVDSADGRWAYTLYAGGEHPFVHALDTEGRAALCIDLHALARFDRAPDLRMLVTRDGRRLRVVDPFAGADPVEDLRRAKPLVDVDLVTFEVTRAEAARRAPAQPASAPGAPVVELVLLAALAAAALATLGARRRRRRRAGALAR